MITSPPTVCVYCGSLDDVQICAKCGILRAGIIASVTGDSKQGIDAAVSAFAFCANCRVYHEEETRNQAKVHK